MGGQYGDLWKTGTSHKQSEKEVGKAGRMGSQRPREGRASRKLVTWCDVSERIGSLDLTTWGLKARINGGS